MLTGFVVVAAAIAVGYAVARVGLLASGASAMLNRLTFYVLAPCLLFLVVSTAQVEVLFSALLPVSAIAAVVSFAIFGAVSLVARRPLGEATIGALAAGYVNANNIGLPISLFVLGDAAYSAPIVLLQLLVFMPIAMILLTLDRGGKVGFGRLVLRTVSNPMVVAAMLGLAVALTGVRLPEIVEEPIALIGGAAVPVMLIAYGMTLHGSRVFEAGNSRWQIVLATVLKMLVMPLVALGVGILFGLNGDDLRAVVVLAALPTAQNVANFAVAYGRSENLARDVILLSSIGSIPALMIAASALG